MIPSSPQKQSVVDPGLRTPDSGPFFNVWHLVPRNTDTETLPLPIIKPTSDVAPDRGWKVLLYNDDVTPFDVVILALQRAAGLSIEVAEMVAVEAHRSGEAVVKRGMTEEDALILCGGLRRWSRIEGICPGVGCDALADDP
ncbi:MAG: ATP-dependent Clp protease adaptor ClpS [Planctomycetes bacterium]|nr:ATP-dependent Clp protease adaptor ClpS [Planctomycetota bacterium]